MYPKVLILPEYFDAPDAGTKAPKCYLIMFYTNISNRSGRKKMASALTI